MILRPKLSIVKMYSDRAKGSENVYVNSKPASQVVNNMNTLITWPVNIVKGVIQLKKNVLYVILVLVILSVFSVASLKTLDYPSDTKAFYNEYMDSALSSEILEVSD